MFIKFQIKTEAVVNSLYANSAGPNIQQMKDSQNEPDDVGNLTKLQNDNLQQ